MSCPRGCCETYREHLLSIGISSAAMPSRQSARYATKRAEAEKTLSKDLAAYKTLAFEQGYQPKQIDGCHELAQKAGSKAEIEAGVVLQTDKQRAQLKEVMDG